MKAKNFRMIVFMVLALIFVFSCNQGLVAPDIKPKPKSVKVEYLRVQPVPLPEAMDDPTLNWEIESYSYNQNFTKTAEDSFTANGVLIKTETRIRIWVRDPRMWNGSSLQVRKIIKVDGQELVISLTYGEVAFVYRNDGTISVVI